MANEILKFEPMNKTPIVTNYAFFTVLAASVSIPSSTLILS